MRSKVLLVIGLCLGVSGLLLGGCSKGGDSSDVSSTTPAGNSTPGTGGPKGAGAPAGGPATAPEASPNPPATGGK